MPVLSRFCHLGQNTGLLSHLTAGALSYRGTEEGKVKGDGVLLLVWVFVVVLFRKTPASYPIFSVW